MGMGVNENGNYFVGMGGNGLETVKVIPAHLYSLYSTLSH